MRGRRNTCSCGILVVKQLVGVDYLARNDNPDRRRRLPINRLDHLSYQVELTPAA